ncbi:calcium-binding protein [Loktanella sp. IMCC34160]|uniref:calcium-binding protein n=1 Tax=Loktanella sp. IMCC34160 TaxID=2510646 RepID=UPI00101C44D9|nr:calcium-binding protein [Loktanella sp. IMCC34160]RYG92645.1 calcium-binding protein [Loktanella sp. IMCC34160]
MEVILLVLIGTIGLAAAYGSMGNDENDEPEGDDDVSMDEHSTDMLGATSSTDNPDVIHLVGSASSDILLGTDDDETLRALQGDDVVLGGAGHDVIFGDDGDDRFLDQSPNEVEDDGNDTIFGGSGNDVVTDTFVPSDISNPRGGDDQFYGGDGDDRFIDFGGRNTAYGGDGNDILSGLDSDVWEDTSSDSSEGPYATLSASISDPFKADELLGDAGNDTLIGDFWDTLVGGTGVDSFKIEQHYGIAAPTTIKDWEMLGAETSELIEIQLWMAEPTFLAFFPEANPWDADGVQANVTLVKLNQTVRVEALGQVVAIIEGFDDSKSLEDLVSSIVVSCKAAIFV